MSSIAFRKLSKIPGMTNQYFTKVDYDLLYKRIQKISLLNQMDIFGFIKALQIIFMEMKHSKKELREMKNKTISIKYLVKIVELIKCK
jgi:hypothetical protein